MSASSTTSVLAGFEATALAAARGVGQRDFLRTAVENIAGMLGAEQCSLLLVDGPVLRRGADLGLPETYAAALDGFSIGEGEGTCGCAAYLGRSVVTEDIETDPSWDGFRDSARAAGLRSCWSVPVRVPGGPVLGTFATYSRRPGSPLPEQVRLAETYATMVGLSLDSLSRQAGVSRSYESVVLALTTALDARDAYTSQHSTATADLARAVGARLGLTDAELEQLALVAQLHDIGKLGIPTDVLTRPGPLAGHEWALMREHPSIGARILRQVPDFSDIATAVCHEHERWDGTGYPDGLAGEQIPLASRIVFACDAYHAMTSDRPYRPARSVEDGRCELRENAGCQFDPRVVGALLAVLGDAEPLVAELRAEHDQERGRALRDIASQLGADDLLVFRRVAPDVFSHLGGAGRGEGWAGNIDLVPSGEPHLVAALAADRPLCVDLERSGRIVGPYHGRTAVIAPVSGDLVVVFGSASAALRDACTERTEELAERAAALVEGVSPAKRLADELEVLDAIRAVTMLPADGVAGTLAACADRATAALSCEWVAMLLLPAEGRPAVLGQADRGWSPGSPGEVEEFLCRLVARPRTLPLLLQDTAEDPALPPGFRREGGASSLLVVTVGTPAVAVLAAVHAEPGLRGFTALCQRVARAIGEASEVVVRRAVAQERLARENRALTRALRVDVVTGVSSRAAWEEALRRAERERIGGSVVVLDLDGLKAINDRDGHAAGDALLRACAGALYESARPGDLVARLGGDEFVVLLPDTGPEGAEAWCAGLRARLEAAGIASSLGHASAPPCPTLAAAVDLADRRMYEAKLTVRPAPALPG